MSGTQRRLDSSPADVDSTRPAPGVVSVASFAGFDPEGRYQVDLAGDGALVAASSIVPLTMADVGVKVVVAFDAGTRRPVIMGLPRERAEAAVVAAKVDGDRVVIRADREIELRCGDSSIVLTRAGKVLIRGSYVLSRSRGANKIKGAYVDIN